MTKQIILFLLFGLTSSLFAQNVEDSTTNITTRDKVEITYKAESIVKEFENLMNVISNSDLFQSEIEDLIKFSYAESNNKIFADEKVTIEDDLDPAIIIDTTKRDVSVDEYLKALDLFYQKSDEPSVTFENFKTSKVYEGEYTFVKVFFESQFKNPHKSNTQPYPKTKRVAEIKAEKKDKQWDAHIVSITYFDNNQPIEEADYTPASLAAQLKSLTGKTSLDSAEARLSLQLVQEAERQRQLQEELFGKMMDEVKRLAEKEEEKKKSASQDLITEGDKAYEKGNYDQALRAYKEAKSLNPYQTEAFSRINRTQSTIKEIAEKKAQEAIRYDNLLRDAAYAYKIREYQTAIDNYREAHDMKSLDENNKQQQRLIEQLVIPLNTLESKYRAGDFNGAVKDYNKAIKGDENNPDLYLGRGKALFRLGKNKQALSDFDQVIKLYPDYYNAYVERSKIHKMNQEDALQIADLSMALTLNNSLPDLYVQRALVQEKLNRLNEAIEDYTWAIKTDSENGTHYLHRGKLQKQRSKTVDAMSDFSKAVELTPELAQAWFQRGLLFNDQEEIEKAAADFQEAKNRKLAANEMQRILNIATGYYQKGITALQGQKYEDAIAEFTKAVTIRPDYTEAWYKRGESHEAGRDLFSAIDDYTEAVKHNDQFHLAYFKKGKALFDMTQYKEAASQFEKITTFKADYFPAFMELGNTQQILKNYQAAFDAYEKAIALDDRLLDAHFQAGKVQAAMSNHGRAITFFTKASKLDSKFPKAYYHRGLSQIKIQEYKKAINDFSAAIQLKSDYTKAYYERAKAYNLVEDYTNSTKDFAMAIQYKSQAEDIHLRSGMVYEKLEEYQNALMRYQKVLELENKSQISVDLYNRMGEMCLRLEEWEKGRAYFENALALDKESYQAQYGLGSAFAGQEQYEPAIEWISKGFASGKFTAKELKNDEWLKPMKKMKEYKQVVKKYLK